MSTSVTSRRQAAATVRPFAFEALEALSRADVDAGARLRRLARKSVALGAIEDAASEILGVRTRITLGAVRRADTARGADDAAGVMLARAGDRSPASRALVEASGALAAAMTSRVLKHRPPRVVDAARTVPPPVAGALAAIVTAIVRKAHAGVALRVIAAGPGAHLARDLTMASGDVTTAWLTVTLGDEAFEARVSVPDAASLRATSRGPSRDDLLAMGDARLALPLVVASTLASRADLAALAPGDAFVPAGVTLALAAGGSAGAAAALTGAVALVAPRAELGLGADLAEGDRLVLRADRLEAHPLSPESRMDDTSTNATVEAALDAPVVVRVELGTVEMNAREWAELGPGDVVTLGRKLGDPAILRVGGVELARGELVQVEGEYAVRILGVRTGDGGGT